MRKTRFTFLCDEKERSLLSALADHLRRSQGDTLRLLVYRAVQELGLNPEDTAQKPQQPEAGSNG